MRGCKEGKEIPLQGVDVVNTETSLRRRERKYDALINLLTGLKKKKRSLKGREAKENFTFTTHFVFSKHPSYFDSLFLGDFALIGGRNERSKFDKAKLKVVISKPN